MIQAAVRCKSPAAEVTLLRDICILFLLPLLSHLDCSAEHRHTTESTSIFAFVPSQEVRVLRDRQRRLPQPDPVRRSATGCGAPRQAAVGRRGEDARECRWCVGQPRPQQRAFMFRDHQGTKMGSGVLGMSALLYVDISVGTCA